MLGFMWTTGIGAPERDQAKAMLYYTFATMSPTTSDTGAEMALGYRHLAGIGTSKSCEEAVWYFRRAAKKAVDYYVSGPPMGGYSLPPAKHRLSDDNGGVYGPGASGSGGSTQQKNVGDGALTPEDVFQYWQYTAERGDATAQLLLGQLYYTGTNAVVQNYLEALRYFQMAATQYDAQHAAQAQAHQQWQAQEKKPVVAGQKPKIPSTAPPPLTSAQTQRLNAAAQASGYVGQMHFRGEGIEADNGTARKWFERGAQRGDAISLTGLGIMHKDGSAGLPRDLKKATSYFSKAAEQNNAEAQAQLGVIYLGAFCRQFWLTFFRTREKGTRECTSILYTSIEAESFVGHVSLGSNVSRWTRHTTQLSNCSRCTFNSTEANHSFSKMSRKRAIGTILWWRMRRIPFMRMTWRQPCWSFWLQRSVDMRLHRVTLDT